MNTARIDRYGTIKARIQALKSEMDTLTREADQLQDEILQEFVDEDTDSVRVNGRTFYLHRQMWASAVKDDKGASDYARTCAALVAAGLEAFVDERFNSQTLSAYVRELPRTEGGDPILPDALVGNINVANVYSVRMRNSTKGKE